MPVHRQWLADAGGGNVQSSDACWTSFDLAVF